MPIETLDDDGKDIAIAQLLHALNQRNFQIAALKRELEESRKALEWGASGDDLFNLR